MRRVLLICFILMTMTWVLSCKKGEVTDSSGKDTDIINREEEPTIAPSQAEDGQKDNSDNGPSDNSEGSPQDYAPDQEEASANTYEFTEASYEKAGVKIKYPKLTGLKDSKQQDKINQLIEKDALKDIEDYQAEGSVLEKSYEVAWEGENLLSITYVVYSNYPGAAHPNHAFYSTNIDLNTADSVKLKDTMKLSDDFVARFITGSKYIGPHENADQGLSDLLEDNINSLNKEGLSSADAAGVYTPYYSYYTEDSLGIGIEVPFVIGGYALYEVPYQDIISYINVDNRIWKDFPEILFQDSFIPIAVEGLLLGGYDGKNWVQLNEALPLIHEGKTYRLFYNQDYQGVATGGAPELDIDFERFYMLEMKETPLLHNIAIGSDQRLASVKPRSAENSYYEEAVTDYFTEIGHPEYEIGYLEGYSFDFDQDGDEEDIICTWQFQDQFYYEVPAAGCYSYVLYRDNKSMKVIQEAYRGEASDYSAEFLGIEEGEEILINSRPEYMSAIDITGDGLYEIIISETGYESWGYIIYELQGDNYIRVLEEFAGV